MKERSFEENALIYVCGLIEEIGRKTKNKRSMIVDSLDARLQNLYDYSDVYHCDSVKATAEELIAEYNIPTGTFDNVTTCNYRVPGSFEIGHAMTRLILMVMQEDKLSPLDALKSVYHSKITDCISNFNTAAWYSMTDDKYRFYKTGEF